jgi:hypothetical protein
MTKFPSLVPLPLNKGRNVGCCNLTLDPGVVTPVMHTLKTSAS